VHALARSCSAKQAGNRSVALLIRVVREGLRPEYGIALQIPRIIQKPDTRQGFPRTGMAWQLCGALRHRQPDEQHAQCDRGFRNT